MKNELKARYGRTILRLGMLFTLTFWASSAGAANKNVWIDSPVVTIEGDASYTTCIGLTDTFVAHQSGHPPGSTWYWSGATRISGTIASPSLAERTWTTSGGPYPVRASYNGESSYAARATVVEVTSLLPDQGELVQGTTPPLYVTCVGPEDILVTATPKPLLAETSLPNCWYFAGGQPVGFGLIQRKLSKSFPGEYSFEAEAGTSAKSFNVKIFEVSSLEPDYGIPTTEVDDGDFDPNTRLYIICWPYSLPITVRANPDPSAADLSQLPSCWTLTGSSGVTIVDKLTAIMSGDTPNRYTVACSSGTSTKVTQIIVLKTELKSIDFSNDHGVLRNNNTDWTDMGDLYGSPEWVNYTTINNPMSYTKNSQVAVTAKVKVSPASVPFELVGSSQSYLEFFKPGNSSTAQDQELFVAASGVLPNTVATLTEPIAWTISVYGISCQSWSSAPHRLYVTYGAPSGSAVTEQRLRDVCAAASGMTDLTSCADAICSHLSSYRYSYPAPVNGPDPIWLLHAGSPYVSQCPGLAIFIDKHFQLLGLGAGEIKYCRAMPDGTYAALNQGYPITRPCTPGASSHPNPTSHDDYSTVEWLCHVDGVGQLNHYEAACLFNGKYYAVGVGAFATPKQVVKESFSKINWFCQAFSGLFECLVSPWVEAP